MTLSPTLSSFTTADLRRTAAAVAGVADVVLRVDTAGAILEAVSGPDDRSAGVAELTGRPMASIVDSRDRGTLKTLLATLRRGEGACTARLRHVPPAPFSTSVRYSATMGRDGAVLLFGRCEPDAPAQVDPSGLVDDAGSRRSRAAQARYQALFETAAEAVVVVSPDSGTVEDANPRALALIGRSAAEVAGRPVGALLCDADAASLDLQLVQARETGEFVPLDVQLVGCGRRVLLEGRVFRGVDGMQIILHLSERGGAAAAAGSPAMSMVARLLHDSGDALAVVDSTGRITWANVAFTAITTPECGAVGRTLGDLTGYSAAVLQGIIDEAREQRRIILYDCALRGADGRAVEGRLTLIALAEGFPGALGVCFRPAGGQAAAPPEPVATSLLGTDDGATMKDMLRDATDEIERSCIEAAMKLTGGNKALAAKALGLSRQSLYVKLRHFGLM